MSDHSGAGCPPLEVVKPNGGANPVRKGDGTMPANFEGYFSPKAGEQFEYQDANGQWQTVQVASDGGCRFGESRPGGKTHEGIDLVGWVEKVTEDGRPPGYIIHLFDTTWQVYPVLSGMVSDKDSEGLNIIHPPNPLEVFESYQHLTDLTDKEEVATTDVLGKLKDLGAGKFVHLHYAVTNEQRSFFDPASSAAGNRGFTITTVYVPEPSSLLVLTGVTAMLGGLALRRKK